jgi:PAS domain S-box-containing protein
VEQWTTRRTPADENTPYNPGDVYQSSKMRGEQLALEYFRSGRIPGVVIRPAMIYGPGDTRTLKLFRMIAGGRFFYVGSGQTLMHFIDVRDLARAFELAMAHADRSGEVYIATGREAVPLCELADFSADYLRTRRPRLHLPVRPMQLLGNAVEAICTPLRIPPPIFRRRVDFYTKNRAFSGEKAARELGFAVTRPFQQEVIEIIDSYLETGMIRMGARGAQEESFLYRSLDGIINGWNRAAAARYGYPSQTAVGAVSHALLKTEFPEPLRRINEQLRERSVWQGRLRHVTREGRTIEVESRWVMARISPSRLPRVIEINREPGGPSGWSIGNTMGSLLCGLPSLAEGLSGLAAV